MGLTGIGAATSLVQALSLIALVVMVRADRILAPAMSLRGFRLDAARLKPLWRLGAAAVSHGAIAALLYIAAPGLVLAGFVEAGDSAVLATAAKSPPTADGQGPTSNGDTASFVASAS